MTTELPEQPLSRTESYLAKAAGQDVVIPEKPESRLEQYLAAIAGNDFFTADAEAEGSGASVEFKSIIKLKDAKLDGDTTQQTYSGKNLLIIDGGTTSQGIITTVENINALTLLVSGTTSSTWANLTSNNYDVGLPEGTYTFCIDKELPFSITFRTRVSQDGAWTEWTIPAGSKSATNTISAPQYFSYIYIHGLTAGTNVKQAIKVQIVSGSSPDYNFEPYVGEIASPNPDYPQAVNVVTGEQTVVVNDGNIFDPYKFSQYTSNQANIAVDQDGSILLSNNSGTNGYARIRTPLKEIVPDLKVGETYYIYVGNDFGNGARNYIYLQDSEIFWRSGESHTITQTDLDGDIALYGGYQQTTRVRIAIFANGQSYPVSLGTIELCKIGDYQDYIYKSGDDWYVHKETKKLVLDGDMDWWYGADNIFTSKDAYSDLVLQPYIADAAPVIISNQLMGANWYKISRGTVDNAISSHDSSHVIKIRSAKFDSDTAFKTWLGTNNATCYYAMTSATDTKITDADLIAQLNALANASGYDGQTVITVYPIGTNLPAILEVTAYNKSLNGLIELIEA